MCFQKFFYSNLFRNLIFAFGVLLVGLAFSCNLFWNQMAEYFVKKELILTRTSKSFSFWVENPTPFYIDFYFFNWTNPNDFKQPGYKPKLKEVGPYKFREEIKKTGIKWNKNKTVTYRKLRRWYFEPDKSCGSLNDIITSLNVIALTAARSTRYWNRMARIPLSITISSTQKMAINKTVREFLFEGFTDPLIEFASKIPSLSPQVPFNKFGWFYKFLGRIEENVLGRALVVRNESKRRPYTAEAVIELCFVINILRNDSSEFDGVFNVETGANGLDVLGKLKFWNFSNHTSFYKDHCGYVKGSAGDFWPLQRSYGDKISLFSPDMCRYINFIYKKKDLVGDIAGHRYDSGFSLFDNGTINPENKCFCEERCFPSGVVNVSTCRFGAPAFVSYPHFYLADSFYLNVIDGLKPEPQKHDMYIILEQEWSIPLEVAIRLQINILIETDPGIRMFDGVPTIFFPMIWFEQKVTIPEYMKREIRVLLALPTIGLIASVIFYCMGFSCVILYIISSCINREREKEWPLCIRRTKKHSIKRSRKYTGSD